MNDWRTLTHGGALRWARETYPNKVAVIYQDRRITYQKLNERVNRLANGLLSLGLKPGSRVAMYSPNCSEYMEYYLAVAITGMAAVPINNSLKEKEVEYILNHSKSEALIYDAMYEELIQAVDAPHISRERRMVLGGTGSGVEYDEFISKQSSDDPEVEFPLSSCYYQGYTSGTTGFPKGCVNNQDRFINHHQRTAIVYGITKEDNQIIPGPLFHGAPTLFSLSQLFVGGTVTILRGFDPEEVLRTIHRERTTNGFFVPVMLERILQLPNKDSYDVSSMRAIMVAGAPFQTSTKLKIISFLKNADINEFYGATEAGLITNIVHNRALNKERSSGKTVMGMHIKIMDDDGNELEVGEIGEIFMNGPILLSEYYENKEATKKTFRGSWFTLGDMGYVDDEGYLYLVDRKKDMIISGGENIYPAEVEKAILLDSRIQHAAVIGIPDSQWGESVKAIVVVKPGEHMTEEEIIEHCKMHIASYKCPKSVDFADSIPINPSGKILKNILREKYWQGKEKRVN